MKPMFLAATLLLFAANSTPCVAQTPVGGSTAGCVESVSYSIQSASAYSGHFSLRSGATVERFHFGGPFLVHGDGPTVSTSAFPSITPWLAIKDSVERAAAENRPIRVHWDAANRVDALEVFWNRTCPIAAGPAAAPAEAARH